MINEIDYKNCIKEQHHEVKGVVVSLYDYTGSALKPWADAGYQCYAFDIQHDQHGSVTNYHDNGGSIEYIHADLHDNKTIRSIHKMLSSLPVKFAMAFPVCTDMAVSGAAHFSNKAKADPLFQVKAVKHAKDCSYLFNLLNVPYFIENPVSVLATKWRKPDHYFHPYEYGGYIAYSEAKHPRWPDYIADFDAYPKKTCLWVGGGFVMPDKVSVGTDFGYSTQHKKLGGKSKKTKDIRSATPRGFAIAVHQSNSTA